ncbi:hypothetical protein STAN_3874 [Streptomyces sp. CBMAI 2042]|nr:hypothetical protein STAN_3874 [Streptomyces sp. CBMAI 2042]
MDALGFVREGDEEVCFGFFVWRAKDAVCDL